MGNLKSRPTAFRAGELKKIGHECYSILRRNELQFRQRSTFSSNISDKNSSTISKSEIANSTALSRLGPLPQKYKPPEKDVVISQSRKEILEQVAAGGKPRLPFRLWRMIFSKCNNYTLAQYVDLSPSERIVHGLHWRAMQERQLTYKDPKTKADVMTEAALRLQGRCCGNACRHCPYDHENVPEDVAKLKKWNGAYYV